MRLSVAALVLMTLVAIAHAQSAGPPALSEGDTWAFKEIGGTSSGQIKVIKVEDAGYLVSGAYSGCPTCLVRTDKHLTWLNLLDSDGKPKEVTTVEFVPIGPEWKFLDFPLEVKETWRISARAFLRRSPASYTVDCTVEAYEDVKTSAEVFTAYRIRRDWALTSPFRASWTDFGWFAPEVKWSVKFTSQRRGAKDWELKSYSVKL